MSDNESDVEDSASKHQKTEDGGSLKLVMDDKMKETRRTEKKERKWALTSLKKATQSKDIKYFNKLISEFGTSKQLGFSFQVC